MQTENKSIKKNKISLVLYIGSIIVAVMGIALLANNIIVYNQTIASYVAQGYDSAEVIAQLPPTQLLPIGFQVIGLYGGLALVLFSMGLIYQKIESFMSQSVGEEVNIESLAVNVVDIKEIEEVEEVLAPTDAEIFSNEPTIPEISADEETIEQPADQKQTTL